MSIVLPEESILTITNHLASKIFFDYLWNVDPYLTLTDSFLTLHIPLHICFFQFQGFNFEISFFLWQTYLTLVNVTTDFFRSSPLRSSKFSMALMILFCEYEILVQCIWMLKGTDLTHFHWAWLNDLSSTSPWNLLSYMCYYVGSLKWRRE